MLKKTVCVAMSGGVDSSVAAALLNNRDYRVFGLTMVHIENGMDPRKNIAVRDARRVCDRLKIPHHTIFVQDIFQKQVIDNFVDEYLAGRTPNPCVLCNRTIKWGVLLDRAMELGADLFATGHYARITKDRESGRMQLLKSAKVAKDQSYALWRLSQHQLTQTILPLGEWEKRDVRQSAAEFGLPIADKAESQDICFIRDDNFRRFIREILEKRGDKIESGDILDADGHKVGKHEGFAFYTIGQRKGLGIAMGHPVYVTSIDACHNQIRIGDKKDLLADGLVADSVNWIAVEKPQEEKKVHTRIRYRDPGYASTIEKVQADSFTIRFDEPRAAVTPGQSAVLYDGDRVVGGGIISHAIGSDR